MKRDRDVVLEAVQQNGCALNFATDEPRRDRDVALRAVQQTGHALQYADIALKWNREVVLEALKNDGEALKYSGGGLRGDLDVVIAALQNDPSSVIYANDDLRRRIRIDRDVIILEVVRKHGLHLFQVVDEKFRSDRYVVLEAVTQNGHALRHAGEVMKREIGRSSWRPCHKLGELSVMRTPGSSTTMKSKARPRRNGLKKETTTASQSWSVDSLGQAVES